MKPNVLKKISSVTILILILIMLVRNVHTTGHSELLIRARYFQHNHRSLTVHKNRPIMGTKEKYAICMIQPKSDFTFYLFDKATKRFICAPKRHGRPTTRRLPDEELCVFSEKVPVKKAQSLYTKLEVKGGNYTLCVSRGCPGMRSPSQPPAAFTRFLVGSLRDTHTGRDPASDECAVALKHYCASLVGNKHHRRHRHAVCKLCVNEHWCRGDTKDNRLSKRSK